MKRIFQVLTISLGACLTPHLGYGNVVAQWHFDEPQGTLVAQDSVGNHDGVLSGSAEFEANGVSGNCISTAKQRERVLHNGKQLRLPQW